MRPFRWTVPSLPLTEKEKRPSRWHPGTKSRVLGTTFILMALVEILVFGDLFDSLRTYFWESAQAVVTESDLESLEADGRGRISYSAMINGVQIKSSEWVSLPKNSKQGAAEWASQFQTGSEVRIYHNARGETTLSRRPSVDRYLITGLFFLVVGVLHYRQGLLELRDFRKTEAELSAAETA